MGNPRIKMGDLTWKPCGLAGFERLTVQMLPIVTGWGFCWQSNAGVPRVPTTHSTPRGGSDQFNRAKARLLEDAGINVRTIQSRYS